MTDGSKWEKRFMRERAARQQAEAILDSKSTELYELNESLSAARADLEKQVQRRTRALEEAVSQLQEEVRLRRVAETRLRSSRDTAVELSELKTQFLARMSHEMRTPLNAVIGLTGVLLDSEMSDEQAEKLQTVRSSGKMLLRIINDILDLSKIDANKLELEYSPVHIESILEQSISLVMLDAARKNMNFKFDNYLGSHDRIVVDGGRIQQLVLNLLSNAVKYSNEGQITLVVELLDEQTSRVPEELRSAFKGRDIRHLAISVKDEGIGIHADDLDELFAPFTQFAGVSAGGTGLGLTICKRLCEIMGGDVTVESEPGNGSTFSFFVPCGVLESELTAADDAGTSSTTLTSTSETGAWLLSGRMDEQAIARRTSMAQEKPLTILLADDYEVNRMVQHAQLEQLGYRADAVANGEEVLRALYAHEYDVILMDIRMPVMDGVETTRRIRQHRSGAQPFIVAVTASALDGDREKFVAAGMDAYISKPVDMGELADVLDQAYATRRKQQTPSPEVALSPIELDFGGLYSRLGPATDSLLQKVIPVYLRELPGRQEGLVDAFAAGDPQAFAQLCHGLKGTSRSIGATELAARCESGEEKGFGGILLERSELDALLDLSNRTEQALRSKLLQIQGDAVSA